MLRMMEKFSAEHLLIIPEGFKNNMLWNFGHVVVTQQLLHYRLSGLEMYIDDDFCNALKKGSDPSLWSSPPDIDRVKHLSLELPQKLAADYHAGKFQQFDSYTTSAGVTLRDIEDAIAFNNFHEGIHAGVMMSMSKLII